MHLPPVKQFPPDARKRAVIYALLCATLFIAVGMIYFYRSNLLPSENTASLRPSAPPASQFIAALPTALTPQTNIAISSVTGMPLTAKKSLFASQNSAKIHAKRPDKNAPQPDIQIDRNRALNGLLQAAYQAYRDSNFELAQQIYSRAITLDANNLDTLLGLAASAQHRGEDALAMQSYQKVLTLDPRNAYAHAGMATLRADEDQESRLKLLLLEQENSASLQLALGNHYAAQSRWGEAQQAYFHAYQLEPDNADISFNLAISLERLEQKKSASQFYLRALQLDAANRAGFDHAATTQRAQKLAE